MLRSRPFAVPRLGYRARIEDNAFNLFLHSRKSWLKWKSVEAERGSPSLTRTTQAKKIMDILRWSTHEDNLKTKCGFRLTIHLGYLPANTQAWNISRLEFIHHCCWPTPYVQPLPLEDRQTSPKDQSCVPLLPLSDKKVRPGICQGATCLKTSTIFPPSALPQYQKCWVNFLQVFMESSSLPRTLCSLGKSPVALALQIRPDFPV